jgi:mxaA protein
MRGRSFIFSGLLLLTACNGSGPVGSAHGQPAITRDYGYVIGDVIPMTYQFDLKGDQIDPGTLPSLGAVNEWLVIRAIRIEVIDHRERQETRLHVDYQIFKGIKDPELVTIPPFEFRVLHHPETTVSTDPWTFTEVPVIPPDQALENIEPHDGLEVPRLDEQPQSQRIARWIVALGVVVSLMGLRTYLIRQRIRPFRRSERKIRASLRSGMDIPEVLEGLRLLHRALDDTYGRTLFKATLPDFLLAFPAFTGMQQDLELFFRCSGRLFFDPSPQGLTEEERIRILGLLNECLRAERGML